MLKLRKIRPPTYFLVTLLAMAGLHMRWPVARIVKFPWSLLGVIPVVVAIAVELIAAGAFKKAGTTIKPFKNSKALVTDGLYRFSRNPMYLAFMLLLAGIAVLLGSLTPWLPIVPFFVLMNETFVRSEEKTLEDKFGDDYRNYKKRVRRWI